MKLSEDENLVNILQEELSKSKDGRTIDFDRFAELMEEHKGYSKERIIEILHEIAEEQKNE